MSTISLRSVSSEPHPYYFASDPGQMQPYCDMDAFNMNNDSRFYLDPNFAFDETFGGFPMAQGNGEMMPGPGGQRLKARVRASRACVACRSRHMKCDSVEPICTRCQVFGKTCVYTKSRRGGSHKAPQASDIQTAPHTRIPSSAHCRTPNSATDNISRSSWDTISNPRTFDSSPFDSTTPAQTANMDDGNLIANYYKFFNRAHPVVLPQPELLKRTRSDPTSLENLIPVLKYIGSVYLPEVSSIPFQELAEDLLDSDTLPNNCFSVQALALFALARHCSDEYDVAERYADKAIDIALAIGMNNRGYAETHGEDNVFLQESWRRTWWLVYSVDALFATISHKCTHRLHNTEMDVDLPCEDAEYESGNIPTPQTLTAYDSREFASSETTFSSLTYLIDSVRIVSTFMPLIHSASPTPPSATTLSTATTKLTNWSLYLPTSKSFSELIQPNGIVDETMFLAHLVINTEKLQLHRPHSHLPYSPLEARSICTPLSAMRANGERERVLRERSMAMHTRKALEAMQASILLFALPCETEAGKHSPLATCALALAVMAQVSACGFFMYGDGVGSGCLGVGGGERAYSEGRDRVRLGLGALRVGVKVWGLAKRSVGEVVGVARELLVGGENGDWGRGSGSGSGSSEGAESADLPVDRGVSMAVR